MDHNLTAAHKHCGSHRAELAASPVCGCFYCMETFPPTAILEWVDHDQTALCPVCGIDSVLGDASGYPITPEFLEAMHTRWFAQAYKIKFDKPS
jgi:hypothetical protein